MYNTISIQYVNIRESPELILTTRLSEQIQNKIRKSLRWQVAEKRTLEKLQKSWAGATMVGHLHKCPSVAEYQNHSQKGSCKGVRVHGSATTWLVRTHVHVILQLVV